MEAIEELRKAIEETEAETADMLRKSITAPGTTNLSAGDIKSARKEKLLDKNEARQMFSEAHHKAYTRTSASGKASSIAAKGPQTSEIHGQVWEQMKQRKDVIDFPQEMQTKAHKKAFNDLVDHYNEWSRSDEGKMHRLHPSHVDNYGEINVGPHTLRHNYKGEGYVIESRMPHMNGKLITATHKTFESAKKTMIRLAQGNK